MGDHERKIRNLLSEGRRRAVGRELHTIDTILNLPGAVRLFADAIRPIHKSQAPTRAQVRLGVAWVAAGMPESLIDQSSDDQPLALIGPGGEYTNAIE